MKEQTRNTEVQINEEEIGKLPKKEFRIMIVKMIKNLENKMEKMQESINKDIEELKNRHAETNNTITEIKNILEGINIRMSETEEWISELEDKKVDVTSEEWNKAKRMKRTENSLRDLRPYQMHQHSNHRCPRKEEKKKVHEKIFEEIIVENFSNMEKEIVNQAQEAQRVPYRVNPRINKPRHILPKLTKTKPKERLLKTARE